MNKNNLLRRNPLCGCSSPAEFVAGDDFLPGVLKRAEVSLVMKIIYKKA
jgi:hypothetical protein